MKVRRFPRGPCILRKTLETRTGLNATFPHVEPESYDKGGTGLAVGRSERLAARLEPFDSYWQAPKDVEKGFTSFTAYYRANYLGHMPADKSTRILVISCGPGY